MLARRAMMAAAGAGGALDFALNAPDATVIAAYRADTYTAGSWPDRVGSEDFSQGTAGNQPAAIADGGADFKNQPVARWDGTDNILRSSTFAQSQPLTVVFIGKATVANATEKIALHGELNG